MINDIRSINGIEFMKELRVLDLRDNKLNDIARAGELVNNLTSLRSVGFAGNKFSKKKNKDYRYKLLKSIVRTRDLDCTLVELDEEHITTDEVVGAWHLDGGSDFDVQIFRFQKGIQHVLLDSPGTTIPELQELTLSNLELTVLMLSPLQQLKRLDLSGNRLTQQLLQSSGIETLSHLESLQLENNSIDGFSFVQTCINMNWPNLMEVWLDGNPCMRDVTHRLDFIQGIHQFGKLNARLKFINGFKVTIEERISAHRHLLKKPEKLRFSLTLEDRGYLVGSPEDHKELDLSDASLQDITLLSRFVNLEKLNLASNELDQLPVATFKSLSNLKELDISDNREHKQPKMLDTLSYLPNLRLLNVKGSASGLKVPKDYAASVFHELPALQSVDGFENPKPLTDVQWLAIEAINDRCGSGSVNPNRLKTIDLRGKGLMPVEFDWLMTCLRQLPIRTLDLRENRISEETAAKRTLIIFLISFKPRELEYLDGQPVDDNEYDNAAKKFEGDSEKLYQKYDASKIRTESIQDRRLARAGSKADAFIKEAVPQAAQATGGFLTKFEILVNFFQIFGLLFLFVPQVLWPDIWIEWTFWTFSFTLDFDLLLPFEIPTDWQYLKFAMFCAFPPILMLLYRVPINADSWEGVYDDETWPRTKRTAWILYFVGLCLSFMGGFLMDITANTANGSLSTNSLNWFVAFALFVTVLGLIWLWNALEYRKKYHENVAIAYLTSYKITLRRVILFVITVYVMGEGGGRRGERGEREIGASIDSNIVG
eukprot:TRINITY_DN1668_c0_g2_i1.p1 TRINITY_DN1668_c0_g2~~TRINITY_DN1668_c0_g2_i1.p1  ORF type:complete len:823 (-),score=280.36 TRINITY_DN1668_c0_g2_i1:625-2931(-)